MSLTQDLYVLRCAATEWVKQNRTNLNVPDVKGAIERLDEKEIIIIQKKKKFKYNNEEI